MSGFHWPDWTLEILCQCHRREATTWVSASGQRKFGEAMAEGYRKDEMVRILLQLFDLDALKRNLSCAFVNLHVCFCFVNRFVSALWNGGRRPDRTHSRNMRIP